MKNEIIESKNHIVAFTDILGFKELIREYESGKRPNLLSEIKEAMEQSTSILKINLAQNEPDFLNWKKHLMNRLFSDCLCTALPANTKYCDFSQQLIFFYLYICSYENALIEKGIFIRGGISLGKFYQDENIIFSGALVDAVEIEKNTVYPRIELHQDLLDEIKKSYSYDKSILQLMLTVDDDGKVFFNNFKTRDVENCIIRISVNQILENNPLMNYGTNNSSIIEDYQNNDYSIFINIVEKRIVDNIEKFKTNLKILPKYFWLKSFLDWNRNLNSSFRNFNT